MTVRELLTRMDAAEFAEWRAFERLEPFGGWAEDYRAGLVASMLANIHRAPGKPTVEPMRFFPWHDRTVVRDFASDDEHGRAIDSILTQASRTS